MGYYEVLVANPRYRSNKTLTYSHEDDRLQHGTTVIVHLKEDLVPAIVTSKVRKPRFTTKPIHRIISRDPIPPQLLELHSWIQAYYPSPAGLITSLFAPSYLTMQKRSKTEEEIMPHSIVQELPTLTTQQQLVVERVMHTSGAILLHGDTGSGKTRVYQAVALSELQAGRSVIILTPEIGLTPQLVESFTNYLPYETHVLHSGQTAAERRNTWTRIHTYSQPQIIIGPRSALFSPVKRVGLIIVDEAHDQAYKQEQAPYYLTSRVAGQLARLHGAKLIFGTATPSISDYYLFSQKGLPILRMSDKAIKSDSRNDIAVVSLAKRENFSRSQWLSTTLLYAIQSALDEKKQSLIFLNRRGSARLVVCDDCGWHADCPRCDIPLTFHADAHHMRCHTCGYITTPPSICKICGSGNISYKSIGTKSIVSELQRHFPAARIQRFDSDSKKDERFDQHYEAIRAGSADIIVGTQTLSKGLDLPLLRVVGVVLADTALYFPDYTAEERTYQLISQVIGRVGRGHGDGSIIVQTYSPESVPIRSALENDYRGFYESQLKERQQFRFPPFCHLLKLTVSKRQQAAAETAAEELAKHIRSTIPSVEVVGPSASFNEKVNNRYNWQLIVKSTQRQRLLDIIAALPSGWSYDVDPANLL